MAKVIATVVRGVVDGVTCGGTIEVEQSEYESLLDRGFVGTETKAAKATKAPAKPRAKKATPAKKSAE